MAGSFSPSWHNSGTSTAAAAAAGAATMVWTLAGIECIIVCRLLDGMVRWFGQERLILRRLRRGQVRVQTDDDDSINVLFDGNS
eukprot:COSAG06_NODE_2531_length_6712_cov_3.173446_3_plen_84_part_00